MECPKCHIKLVMEMHVKGQPLDVYYCETCEKEYYNMRGNKLMVTKERLRKLIEVGY